jgi:signal transduction histidine kinase
LVVFGAAVAAHLANPGIGDVAAAVRLGQVIVLPALAAVAYRHVVEQLLHYDTFEPSTAISTMPDATRPAPGFEAASDAGPAPAAEMPSTLEVSPTAEVAPPVELAPVELMPDADETRPTEAVPQIGPEPPPPDVLSPVGVAEALRGFVASLEPDEAAEQIARAVATALRSDVALLLALEEDGLTATIIAAYDNILQSALPATPLALSEHPQIVNALGRLRQIRLTTQRDEAELQDLYDALEITHIGPAYVQPLAEGEERLGALIVALPYSKRTLDNQERNLLDRLGPLVTSALLNVDAYTALKERVNTSQSMTQAQTLELQGELDRAQAELTAAHSQIGEMTAYIRDLRQQLEATPKPAPELEERLKALTEENTRLRGQVESGDGQRQAVEALQRELEESRLKAQTEIASLRAQLVTVAIAQQEVNFLQEQLAIKAREAIDFRARLTEAQIVAEALREQLRTGTSNDQELERLQALVAEQTRQIEELQAELDKAQTSASMDFEAMRQQLQAEAVDQGAVAELQAALAERSALIGALEAQLKEKADAIVGLRAHMAELDSSLQALQGQLSHKTQEVEALQHSLAETRQQARARIEQLQAELGAGRSDQSAVQAAEVEALEAELAEKAAAIGVLEEQLADSTQALQQMEKQLAETTAAVEVAIRDARQLDTHDEVIASIAQELRTPMSSITGYTDLLLGESVGIIGALQRKFLQRVKANTERMGTLLDDLIRVTTLDTGRLTLEPEHVDVVGVLEEAITDTISHFREKGLTLRLSLADGLPDVTADRDGLQQVFTHLLLNACLASPVSGEVMVNVMRDRIALIENGGEREADFMVASVEDSGGGIAVEDYERVFSRKFRADNPLIEGLGDTGVGLSIAKALIEAHGGRIWLESEEGIGSTFTFLLPLERPHSDGALEA